MAQIKAILEKYANEGRLLNEKQPLFIIYRKFREDAGGSTEVLPEWEAQLAMEGLAMGNEPLVASARMVAVEFCK